MPAYGTILCKSRGVFRPVMRGMGAFPNFTAGLNNATFGASNDRPILTVDTGDVINVANNEQVILANLGMALGSRSGIITGWNNTYINFIPGSAINNVDCHFAIWRPGLPAFSTIVLSPDFVGVPFASGCLWGNPVRGGIGFRWNRSLVLGNPGDIAADYGAGQSDSVNQWDGPDLANTTHQGPSWVNTNGTVSSFMQDGLPGGSLGPSIAIVRGSGISTEYNYLTFDDPAIDALFRTFVASLAPAGRIMTVPEGYLYSTGTVQILIAGDGSYYKIFTPVAGDAIAAQMLSPAIVVNYTWDNSAWFLYGNSYFFYSAQSGPLTPQVLSASLLENPRAIYAVETGCWPCYPTAQGIK